MSAQERSGITIVIDSGKRRTIVNIPVAEDVDVETTYEELLESFSPWCRTLVPPKIEALRFSFKPIGTYTIKEEDLP